MIRVDLKIAQHWERVRRESERVQKRTLFKAGGFGRKVMKNSIRKRKGPSRPGSPPHSHVGPLRDLMAYEVDQSLAAVTIGPKIFRASRGLPTPVPEVLDVGGHVTTGRRRRRVKIAARPFVRQAFEKTTQKLPDLIQQARS